MTALRRFLCRRNLLHSWQPVSGLSPLGYENRECKLCHSRKFFKLRNWKEIT